MKIAIIGGGASGMMAAIMLARNNHDVTIFEKNKELGKKILITGKGRCNVTNTATGEEFLSNVVRGSKFLISGEKTFNSEKTIEFFEGLGVKLKVERGGRVFPVSDKASSINSAFFNELSKNNVKILNNTPIFAVFKKNDKFEIKSIENQIFDGFDACVIATGGMSYPTTGSTGDGLKIAKNFGHTIEEIKPALNGIEVFENVKPIEGLSLKNVKVKALLKNKTIHESEIGEMIITSVGISGPLVLTMSSLINRANVDQVAIDFKPALTLSQLEDRIDREIESRPTQELTSLLRSMLPARMVDYVISRLNLNPHLKLNQLTRNDRKNIALLLKSFTFRFKKIEPVETSVITSGGVNLKEINSKDMQSKLVPGLFFIGEVLDCDALTGGFNLQIAFSSAVACSNSQFFNKI